VRNAGTFYVDDRYSRHRLSHAMLLVVVCGFPASGKSLIADELSPLYKARGLAVEHICDGEVHSSSQGPSGEAKPRQPRASMYADSTCEKATRARLKTAAERALAPNTVVIVDSLNYIKGFRYELFCVAKTAGARLLVVHVDTTAEICRQQDGRRSDAYGEQLVAELIQRFEPPDSRNRWDRPLHVVQLHGPIREQHLPTHSIPEVRPGDWRDALAGVVETSLTRSAPLKKSFATKTQQAAGADVLSALDRATRNAESFLVSAIQGGAGLGDKLDVPGATRSLILSRRCKVAELRGMRRAHLNLARLCPPKHVSEQDLVDAYLDYVSAQLKGSPL
jgi:protein KTI12